MWRQSRWGVRAARCTMQPLWANCGNDRCIQTATLTPQQTKQCSAVMHWASKGRTLTVLIAPLFAEMAHEQIATDPDAQMRNPYTAHTSLALCQRIS